MPTLCHYLSTGLEKGLHNPQETSGTHEDGTVRTGVRAPPLHRWANYGVSGERNIVVCAV